ncbi:MAG TPA: class I SAM-dependent methyltransferase [Vicinamibacterales bacterium]|jgi:SAM-dependent methyltransferase
MIERWSVGDAGAGMDEEMLVRLAGEIERHPWWQARARLTLALLDRAFVMPPADVLDAGCGWGVTLAALERRRFSATGLDVSTRALERLDQRARRLILADLTKKPPQNHPRFDAVLALDVIEHIDDDRSAVANVAALAKIGGLVVLSVPALQELFSEFDEVQGHRRRYDETMLRRACEGTGLEVQEMLWWGRTFVPLLRWQRRRRKGHVGERPDAIYERYVRAPRPPLSWAFAAIAKAETKLTLSGRARSGTSLFALARRTA